MIATSYALMRQTLKHGPARSASRLLRFRHGKKPSLAVCLWPGQLISMTVKLDDPESLFRGAD